jgi:hypothetical protein
MKKTTHYISTRGNGPIKHETFPKGTVFIALHPGNPLRLPIADRKFWDRLIQRQKGIV